MLVQFLGGPLDGARRDVEYDPIEEIFTATKAVQVRPEHCVCRECKSWRTVEHRYRVIDVSKTAWYLGAQ